MTTEPRSSDDRLLDLFDDHVGEKYPEWTVTRSQFGTDGHRMLSPTEPCDRCGKKVFLMLPKRWQNPVWLTLGEMEHANTLFPTCRTRRHKCGDGDSWSVEAALFVDAAMREWTGQAA